MFEILEANETNEDIIEVVSLEKRPKVRLDYSVTKFTDSCPGSDEAPWVFI